MLVTTLAAVGVLTAGSVTTRGPSVPSIAIAADSFDFDNNAMSSTTEGPEVGVVQAYAQKNEVDVDTAEDGLALEEKFLAVEPSIRSLVPPDRLGGIAITHGSDGLPILNVRLTAGSEVPGLMDLLEPLAGHVVVGDADSSLADRVRVVENHSDDWDEQIEGLEGVYVAETTDRIVLMVDDPTLGPEGTVTNGPAVAEFMSDNDMTVPRSISADRYSGRASADEAQAPFKIVLESAAPSADGNRGGRDLASCTSGFVVKTGKTGSYRRLLTAAHCSDYQPWYGFGGAGPHATSRRGEQHNSFSDLAWYALATDHTLQPKAFYESTSSAINQRANGPNVEGMSACHRGKTTGFSCGTVMSITYQPSYAGACNGETCEARFVLAGDIKGEKGDSGGPVWSAGIVPVGIYKGQNDASTERNKRIWWTKLGNMPGTMEIWVP